jgi:calcium-dependent protein kinase
MGVRACTCCNSGGIQASSKISADAPIFNRNKRILQYSANDNIEDVYELDKSVMGVIARSASGAVLKARHKKEQTQVAVKQLMKNSFKGEWWAGEVETLKKIDHPYICRIYEIWEDATYVYLVMEHCQGGDLTSLCQRQSKHMTEATVSILVRQMVGALEHFHSCGTSEKPFVHTDIRLENWLFAEPLVQWTSAAEMCLKMIDFGLAHRHALVKGRHHQGVGEDNEGLVQKRVGVRDARSAFCKAPEQITDKKSKTLHPGMDIWALGVITFFLLAGKAPFPREPGNLNCERVMRAEFKFEPESAWKAVSSDAKDFIKKCLQVDPAARPTAHELQSSKWMISAKSSFDNELAQRQQRREQEGASNGGTSARGRKSQGGSSARGKASPRGRKNADSACHDAPLPSSDDIVKAFNRMQQLNNLEKCAITAAAHRLPAGKIDHLRQAFEKMDKNGDGVLSAHELYQGLKESGVEESKLLELLKDIDSDGSGFIEYTEFIAAAWDFQRNLQSSIVWGVFKLFDTDGSGAVSKKEIKQLLCTNRNQRDSLQEAFPDTLEEAIDELDKDGNGQIDFEEFKILLNQGKRKR